MPVTSDRGARRLAACAIPPGPGYLLRRETVTVRAQTGSPRRVRGDAEMRNIGNAPLADLSLQDLRVHGLGDRDKLGLPLQHDQRQPVLLRRLHESARHRPDVPAASPDRQRGHPGGCQPRSGPGRPPVRRAPDPP